MGVNISALVERKEIKFEDLKGKIIAIDAFNALYQFLSSIRGADGALLTDSKGRVTSHLQGLFSRTLNLMGRGIKLVYVFDGESPELKILELEKRKERKLAAGDKYRKAVDEEDVDSMLKYSKQSVRLTPEMVNDAKGLLKAMGIPVVEAPSEAEAQAAFMCKRGDVYAAASQDFDALMFGSLRLIRNLTLSQKRKLPSGKYVETFLEMIELKDLLKILEINQEQLICLGILVGTDFNVGGVKGIGPKKALKIVEEKKKKEKIFEGIDVEWRAIYEIFSNIPVTDKYKLKWEAADFNRVRSILVNEHDFSEERVMSLLEKSGVKKGQKDLSSFF